MYVKKLSDITDDMQIICMQFGFTESFENFKFSDNVHTLKLSYYDHPLNDINYPKNLKYLYVHCGPDRSNIQIMQFSQCTRLEKLILNYCTIDNLIVPENLKILVLYSSMFKNYDFPHELFIISSYCIDDPKFERVKLEDDDNKFHYIYLKWPRSHFIKGARI